MRELRSCPQPRPFPLEIAAADFAFAVGHRGIAISFVASTLKPLALASTDPDTRRRPVEYRQILRNV
jgi:hypothetical protein